MANFLKMYLTKEDAEYNGGEGHNALYLPAPSINSAKQTVSTIVSSGRDADGVVYAQRILDRNLVKLEIQWKYLTATQWKDILTKINAGRGGFYVWIRYFDMESASWKCREFYPGDRTALPFRIDPNTKAILSYLDCTVNFIDTGAEEATVI